MTAIPSSSSRNGTSWIQCFSEGGDQLGGIGLEHHRSSENGTIPGFFTDWARTPDERDLLAHEFTHSWNGKFRRPADLWTPNYNVPMRDSLLWVYEGQTQYWGEVLATRAGLWTKQNALDAPALNAATYDTRAGRQWRPLQDDIPAGRTEGISTRRPTDTFSGQSLVTSISGDGRFVGFESNDVTLVRNDTNGFLSDAFVFDRERRRLELVSRNDEGEQGNDDSFGALVSDDGETVVFSSRASNLSRRDNNQAVDVFRRDLDAGETERIAADDRIDEFRPFGFDVVATDITPRARTVALLTRADLKPEQDVGFFVADVYVLETRDRDGR